MTGCAGGLRRRGWCTRHHRPNSPLGVVMSLRRRMQLLTWATQHRAVVKDDYDTSVRYSGQLVQALRSLDQTESISYLGSSSKAMLPIFCMGFLLAARPAPRPARHPVVRRLARADTNPRRRRPVHRRRFAG
jgi:hypothetical protein